MRAGKQVKRTQVPKRSGSNTIKKSGAASSKGASNFDDAQSMRSYRSVTSRVSGGVPKRYVHHEDPAAAMNPSEEQWNQIVQ